MQWYCPEQKVNALWQYKALFQYKNCLSSYDYRYQDTTVMRQSYLNDRNSYTVKTTSSYSSAPPQSEDVCNFEWYLWVMWVIWVYFMSMSKYYINQTYFINGIYTMLSGCLFCRTKIKVSFLFLTNIRCRNWNKNHHHHQCYACRGLFLLIEIT